jgi:hypothetical protein
MLDSGSIGPHELEKCKKFARIAYNIYCKALTSNHLTVQGIRIDSVWCIKMRAAANAPAGLGGRTAVRCNRICALLVCLSSLVIELIHMHACAYSLYWCFEEIL